MDVVSTLSYKHYILFKLSHLLVYVCMYVRVCMHINISHVKLLIKAAESFIKQWKYEYGFSSE